MAPAVCFCKDFDSFTLESDYLEIVYGSKPFRFGYATNHADRKFFVKISDKAEVTLPEMLLQYEDQAEFDTAYRLNLCAEFEDALKFGNFVETLTRVAGYHQVQHDCELSTNATSDSENEDDMGESDIRENILNQHHIVESGSEKEMNPLITLTEGQPFRYTFNQRGFEVHHRETRTHWRFLHPHIRHRQFKANPPGRTTRDRIRYLIRNVTLQTVVGARGAAQYVNVGPCDVELNLRTSTHPNLTNHLHDRTYRYTAV